MGKNASTLRSGAMWGKDFVKAIGLSDGLTSIKNLPSRLLLQFAADSCCDIKAEGGAAERDMTAVGPFAPLYSISSSAVCAFNLFHLLSHAT